MRAVKVIAVVGSGSGCGKTTLVCRILEAVPGLGAVKVSPREGEPRVEWGPGVPGKDTSRYAACGAVKVARIVAPRSRVAEVWERVAPEFAGCAGVVVEGGGNLPREGRLTILVLAPGGCRERPERAAGLLAAADIVVAGLAPDSGELLDAIRGHFTC